MYLSGKHRQGCVARQHVFPFGCARVSQHLTPWLPNPDMRARPHAPDAAPHTKPSRDQDTHQYQRLAYTSAYGHEFSRNGIASATFCKHEAIEQSQGRLMLNKTCEKKAAVPTYLLLSIIVPHGSANVAGTRPRSSLCTVVQLRTVHYAWRPRRNAQVWAACNSCKHQSAPDSTLHIK